MLARIYIFFSSARFFWLVIGLFIFQALWLVFSALYPMAFDEAYHYRLTQVYAQQWLPFLTEHPEGYNFNAVTRYPSYLFHYLLSFPYRALALLTDNQTTLVISLRLINVAIFTYALVLWRKLFRLVGVSQALTHLGILLFTLIPIVPLLAAHINYDNALMLLLAWLFLLSYRALTALKQTKLPVGSLLLIAVVAAATPLVKYAALPIVAAVVAYIAIYGGLQLRKSSLTQLRSTLQAEWQQLSRGLRILLPVLLILVGILFFERFGLNLIRYQALIPACDVVLTVEQCMEFGPYERNYQYKLSADPNFEPNLTAHLSRWFSGMWYRLFFMINGDVPQDRYHNFPPLPIMAIGATVILLFGIAAFLRYFTVIIKGHPYRQLLLISSLFYMVVLWYKNFQGYATLGRTAALNGRYLILILLPIIALLGLGLSRLLADRQPLKTTLACLAILIMLQGGGVISFIVRSNDTWYWQNQTVTDINNRTEQLLHPVIYGSQEMHLRHIPR